MHAETTPGGACMNNPTPFHTTELVEFVNETYQAEDYCCGHPVNTKTVPTAHSYNGNVGNCIVCNDEGPWGEECVTCVEGKYTSGSLEEPKIGFCNRYGKRCLHTRNWNG